VIEAIPVPMYAREDDFREAMSRLATGVVMVTTRVGSRPWGMTVSAVCPVCTRPPTMLVALTASTVLARAIEDSGRFGVSVLGADTIEIARFGATAGAAKFLDELPGALRQGEPDDSPQVVGCVSHVDCLLTRRISEGDHVLYLGRVLRASVTAGEGSLVYCRRSYHGLEGFRGGGG
jgi:flavin reductase (DIM6/NTAB) family NADH-FMN oxidoreductase RutF